MPRSRPAAAPSVGAVLRRLAPAVPLAALLLAGCSDDGRELRPPSPDQTLSIITTSTSTAPDVVDTAASTTGSVIAGLSLGTPFGEGGRIAPRYTCKGDDVAPALTWENVPAGTAELAVTVIDLDSNPSGFVHWVIAGLDPATAGVAEGRVPAGAAQAENDFGALGYGGPCPPTGEHTYLFTLYALGRPSGLTDGAPADEAIAVLEETQLASVSVGGLFGTAP